MSRRSFVCRCEDVTRLEIDHAIELGLAEVEELKRYTGLGTGPCQGKECMSALVGILVERGLADPATVQPFTARPPTEPITLGALASAYDTPLPSDAPLRTHTGRDAIGGPDDQDPPRDVDPDGRSPAQVPAASSDREPPA